jgi:hypothetical protein
VWITAVAQCDRETPFILAEQHHAELAREAIGDVDDEHRRFRRYLCGQHRRILGRIAATDLHFLGSTAAAGGATT